MISGTKKRFASTFNTPPIGNNFSRPNPFDTEYNDGFKHGNWWREETNEDIPQTVDDFLSWFGNVYQTIIKQPYVPSPYDRKLTKKLFYDIKITRKRSNTDGDDGYFFKIMMDHAWKVLTSDEFGVGKPMKRTIQTVYSRFDDEYRNRASTLIASHKRIRAFIKNKEHDPGLKA